MAARVLVIEDNPTNMELMCYLLESRGFTCLKAADGESGVELAGRERPDLVLCDIQLPRMSGFDVLSQIRGGGLLPRDVPILAVTALAMVGDKERILSAGFDGYMPKPISPRHFVDELRLYLPPQPAAPPQGRETTVTRSAPQEPTGHTILVVDNLQSNLDLAEVLLKHMGYRVVQASGVQAALKAARQAAPQLIMSDVNMGDGDGFGLLEQMRGDPLLRHIPVILITSTAVGQADRARGLALGAKRFLFRPIDPRNLRDEIEACLN